jgi:ABC-type antimicrobial peptide transport system permease subunit
MKRLGLYWRYSTRSLARGGQRTLLAIFCVAVGVMAIVALQLVGNMVNEALTGNIRAGNGGDISVRSDITPLNAQDVQKFESLKSTGTITDYTAVDDQQVTSPDASGHVHRYSLDVVDPTKFPLAGAPTFVAPSNGSLPSILQGDSVVVTDALLTQLHLHKGDSVTVYAGAEGRTLPATIGGVIKSAGFFNGSQMLVSVTDYQALPSSTGQELSYSVVYANVPGHTDANEDTAKKDLQNLLPLATVTTTKDALQQNQQAVGYVRDFLQIIGLLALLIGGVGIINTMQVLLRRRRLEIAMLKTAGYRQADLYALFGLEAALLGLAGGVIGAAAGVGVSFLVKIIVERTIDLQLPSTIDPLTVLSGVAIGFVTALIFGIMPIVQSSQVRPQAVLREEQEIRDAGTIGLTIGLGALLAALFFVLTLAILQNPLLAITAVGGAGIFLGLLSLAFALVVLVISHLPVPERFSWGYLLLILGVLAVSALIFLGSRPLGSIFLALALLGIVVVLLPRTWKTNVKLALRNIGRQRARTVTTLVALYIGVFSIGLILALGQNVENLINNALNNTNLFAYNSIVFVGAHDKPTLDAELGHLGIDPKNYVVNTQTFANPVSVDGVPFGDILNQATQGGGATSLARDELLAYLSIPVGYDLANNHVPDAPIIRGASDTSVGRALTSADAGTTNVVLPQRASDAPLHAKLGSQIVLASQDGKTTLTVTVVGFYCTTGTVGCPSTRISLSGGGMYTDDYVTGTLGGAREAYVYSLNLPPQRAKAQIDQIQQAVPDAQAITLVGLSLIITNILNNIIIMLTALASLAMIAGIIIIANAVALAMLERRRELGILKAVGHTSSDVLGEVLIENGIIGFTGGLLAMLLVSLAMLPLAVFLFKTNFGVSALITIGVIAAAAIICMVVAAIVAWGATRVRPLEVLRYE